MAATSSITGQIKNYDKLMNDLKGIKESSEKAVSNTVKDMKSRAPGWIASAVTEQYNIKKGEIMPKSTSSSAKPQKKAGGVSVRGDTIETLQFVYEGRLLTPTHFGMKPTSRPTSTPAADGKKARRAKPYTVTAEIKKGGRKALGGKVFLGTNKGAGQIPFQRKGDDRLPIESIKTVSMPQMVTNEKVAGTISDKLSEGLETRLNHHMSRQLGT